MNAAAPPRDPRPEVTHEPDGDRVVGSWCQACGYRLAIHLERCPVCREPLSAAVFGPGGRIWALTSVHISVQERPTPYVLAYVDLDDGPRILAHVHADPAAFPLVGDRVVLAGLTSAGDPLVRPTSPTATTASGPCAGDPRGSG
jgi:uncharacterized OB-fold protein